MTDAYKAYWTECIECSFEEACIEATTQQIETVACVVQGAHENYGEAFYPPPGPHPLAIERDEALQKLAAEREKVHCKECGGQGRIVSHGPYHSSDSQCWKCGGEGRHAP